MASHHSQEEPRDLTLGRVNCSVATTPLPATSLQAFVPFYQQPRHQPFIAKKAWRSAINGIRALKRLKMSLRDKQGVGEANSPLAATAGGGSPTAQLRSDLVVASGHKGRLLLWNADTLATINTTHQHGSGVVTQLIVTNTKVISIMERDASRGGSGGDDSEVFVWDMVTMALDTTLSGHEDRVTCIVVDAENENHILSGSNDRTVLEWMLPSPNPIARYVGHTSAVTQICFVFGRYFMTGSYDCSLKLWESTVKGTPRVAVHANQRPPRRQSIRLTEGGGLQRTASAKAMRLASVREAHALCTLEGHQGQISYLDNMSEEGSMNMKRPSSASSKLFKAMGDNATTRTVSMVSACNGGLVRCHAITFVYVDEGADGASGSTPSSSFSASTTVGMFPRHCFGLSTEAPPLLQWSNKAHQALVKDVCWDGHIVVSASLSDGLAFYNTLARVTNKISFGTGVRHLAIDAMRRLVVCGCENGQLSFYNYDGFYGLGQHDHYSYKSKQDSANDDTVVLAASFQPHTANITGMLLERTINGQWERLITTSSDSTFFVMDFDVNRDAKVFPIKVPSQQELGPSISSAQYLANAITPIADCGSFLLGNGADGGFTWDILGMARRVGEGKSVSTAGGEAMAASGVASSDTALRFGETTVGTATNTPTMAGAASKALSRQSTPPPSVIAKAMQQGPNVTCCAYYAGVQRVAVGAANGTLRLYPLAVEDSTLLATSLANMALSDGPGSPARTYANPNDQTHAGRKVEVIGALPTNSKANPMTFEGGMFPRLVSEECVGGGIVACCLERGSGPGANRTGGVVLIDVVAERLVTAPYPLPLVPIGLKLFSFDDPDKAGVAVYVVLVQLRTGQIVLLTGSSSSQQLVQQRVVLKDQFPYYPDREAEGTLPMPTPMFAALDRQLLAPRVNVMVVEKGILRSMLVPIGTAGGGNIAKKDAERDGAGQPSNASSDEIHHLCALPFFEMVNVTASLASAIPVVAWAPMRLSGYLAAVALANGTVTIVTEAIEKATLPPNATPDVLREYRPIDIYHNGSVADHVLERNARTTRRRYVKDDVNDPSIIADGSGEMKAVQCVSITVSPHARMLAMGYSDGVIQLWDFATRRVNRRINTSNPLVSPLGRPILHLAIYSRENRLLSITDGELRFDTLYGRNVSEPQNTPALLAEEGSSLTY